ncbi:MULTISPECIES: endonuclease NucS domain-containing protein [Bacillus cereus group]|uniref:Endonuclease NucS n=1 Tax=Bacillus paranthracis TaxID=2026186 RepID=A0AAX3QB86_9BACI|nr:MULTISPECIES: endonuclease NucS domain-containing protein [Bacillus cereus group]WES06036.1 endonuclease NucS [Bacillus paranthracis]WKT30388.1 endonuclease NucS [Bacillus cereus]HDR4445023.1 DUF91 domain-containing protein [Bacillus cereus]
MKEMQLHDLLISNPDLIEEGCTFLKREVNLQGKRCDLLFQDKEGRELYIEVKLKVDDRAVGQLLRYDGLSNNPHARFMLAGLSFVPGLKDALTKHNYEYKEIALKDKEIKEFPSKHQRMARGKTKYNNVEELINEFGSEKIKSKVREIFECTLALPEVFYYLSDGIMFKRTGRNYKFLSISTRGNRILFHVPVNRRDEIFNLFEASVNIYLPSDPRDKNQIDIMLEHVNSVADIKPLIQVAYEKRE